MEIDKIKSGSDVLTIELLNEVFSIFRKMEFTTLDLVDFLIVHYPDQINQLIDISPKNYRSMVGSALRKYSIKTHKITQISKPAEAPIRWKLFN